MRMFESYHCIPNRIIYEISEPDVYILAVIHKRCNVSAGDIKRG